jgi:hypothetical protein
MPSFRSIVLSAFSESGIVADGPERLAAGITAAVLPGIRQAVEAEYAERLSVAGWISTVWLRWEMNARIDRLVREEVDRQFPSDYALF